MTDIWNTESIISDSVADYFSRGDTNHIAAFQKTVLDYYEKNARSFPWRCACTPYAIFVSEIMLQQTQTERVAEKFTQFMSVFPTVQALAGAALGEVLACWQGLGYNRRAKFLHDAAKIIVKEHSCLVPSDPEILVKLPGVGKATAASIAAYAYDVPAVFIETNIRAVFIHTFFHNRGDVTDAEIYPLVQETLYIDCPSLWYSALMDYGVMLKKNFANPSRKSRHHVKQAPFAGSRRRIRGLVIKCLVEKKKLTIAQAADIIKTDTEELTGIITDMAGEGLIILTGQHIVLPE